MYPTDEHKCNRNSSINFICQTTITEKSMPLANFKIPKQYKKIVKKRSHDLIIILIFNCLLSSELLLNIHLFL